MALETLGNELEDMQNVKVSYAVTSKYLLMSDGNVYDLISLEQEVYADLPT